MCVRDRILFIEWTVLLCLVLRLRRALVLINVNYVNLLNLVVLLLYLTVRLLHVYRILAHLDQAVFSSVYLWVLQCCHYSVQDGL